MEYLILTSIILLFAAVIYAAVCFKRGSAGGSGHDDAESLNARIVDSLQKVNLDISERITRSSGDVRDVLSEKISEKLLTLQQLLNDGLAGGRVEQAKSLESSTMKLETKFDALQAANSQQLEAMRTNMDNRLQDMSGKVQLKLDENIKEGFKHFERVTEQLVATEKQLQAVGEVGTSINELNNLMKMPHMRGNFGEVTLERLLSDFLPASLFELQAQITPGSTEAVDAVVILENCKLPIDSKFPREQVKELFDGSDAAGVDKARDKLRRVIREEGKRIRKYIKPEHGTAELALMFLPSETLYFEIIRNVRLCEELHKMQIFPVSPNTLAVTLKSIQMSYNYYEMAQNVRSTIEDVHKARKHFSHFEKKFQDVGKSIDKAQDAYRTAGTHIQRYAGSVTKLISDQQESIEDKTDGDS